MKIRSSTIFHLLCWAIGVLAAGLLAMVAAMVCPYIFPDRGPKAEATKPPPPLKRARQVSVVQAAGTWQDRFWPEDAKDNENAEVGDAKDAGGGHTFIGSVLGPGGNYAFLQRQSDRRMILVRLGNEDSEIKIKKLSKDVVVAEINNQVIALRKVNVMRPKVTRKKGRPGKPRTVVKSGQTPSYRLASHGSGRSPSATISGSSSSTQGRNWKKYWADRLRRQRAQKK